jgi:hypothetical protein
MTAYDVLKPVPGNLAGRRSYNGRWLLTDAEAKRWISDGYELVKAEEIKDGGPGWEQ